MSYHRMGLDEIGTVVWLIINAIISLIFLQILKGVVERESFSARTLLSSFLESTSRSDVHLFGATFFAACHRRTNIFSELSRVSFIPRGVGSLKCEPQTSNR